MKNKLLALPLTLVLLMIVGCASTAPTPTERVFFDISTNYTPKLVLQTNIVQLYTTNQVVNYITNRVTEAEVNVITITNNLVNVEWTTNIVIRTNIAETYTYNANTNSAKLVETVRGVGNMFGPFGEIAGILVAGALGFWARYRTTSAANKSSLVLAQVIETGRELMRAMPNGAEAEQKWLQWMISHQAETKTISNIAELLKLVNNDTAKGVSDQILKLIEETKPKTS